MPFIDIVESLRGRVLERRMHSSRSNILLKYNELATDFPDAAGAYPPWGFKSPSGPEITI